MLATETMNKLIPRLLGIWRDPVWGAVIAGIILAAGAFIWRWLFRSRTRKLNLRVELRVKVDPDFGQVTLIDVQIQNPSMRKSVSVASLEFVTKEHWEMPDPHRKGLTAPVVNFLPRNAEFIKISPKKGEVATKIIGEVIQPRTSFRKSFRLITDYAPYYGIGLFPYDLGVTLLTKDGLRLVLTDIIVSLHGATTLSITEHSSFDPFIRKPGDNQSDANSVLTRIEQGALSPPEVLDALRKAVRVVM